MPSFQTLRILILGGCLIFFGLTGAHQLIYSRNWTEALEVVVFPINADRYLSTDDYIASLKTAHFSQIDRWMSREAHKYNLSIENPVQVKLGPAIKNIPPEYPVNGTPIHNLVWGLRFRWWAFKNTPKMATSLTRVRIFVLYYDEHGDKPLAHSLGMQKGLLGLVHAYATHAQTAQNNIVIAHEFLHTVGAADKYERWGVPMYPYGYANINRSPLFPQRNAEIMAGRIPVSYTRSYMAESLKSVIINRHTAREINWLE